MLLNDKSTVVSTLLDDNIFHHSWCELYMVNWICPNFTTKTVTFPVLANAETQLWRNDGSTAGELAGWLSCKQDQPNLLPHRNHHHHLPTRPLQVYQFFDAFSSSRDGYSKGFHLVSVQLLTLIRDSGTAFSQIFTHLNLVSPLVCWFSLHFSILCWLFFPSHSPHTILHYLIFFSIGMFIHNINKCANFSLNVTPHAFHFNCS